MASNNLRFTISIKMEGKTEVSSVLDDIQEKSESTVKNVQDSAKGVSFVFKAIKDKYQSVNTTIKNVQDSISNIGFALRGVREIYQTLDSAISTFIDPADEFEQLRIRLVNLYQDGDKANQVFEKFKEIAATTPYELTDVVNAGAQLKAFGLDAENTLKSITDLAAYMGVDVVTASNAVGRAFAGGAGAADILRERGVLELIKSFKGIEDLTDLTLPEFRQAMLDTFEDSTAGIAGSTNRLSESYSGSISNMKDSWTSFAAEIGSKFLPVLKTGAEVAGTFFKALSSSKIETTTKEIEAQRIEFETLAGVLETLSSNTLREESDTQQYKETINKLNTEYSEYVGHLDDSIDRYSTIKTKINEARQALIDDSVTRMISVKRDALVDDIAELRIKKMESTINQSEAEAKLLVMEEERQKKIQEVNQKWTEFWEKNPHNKNAAIIQQANREYDIAANKSIRQKNLETKLITIRQNLNKRTEQIANKTKQLTDYTKAYSGVLNDLNPDSTNVNDSQDPTPKPKEDKEDSIKKGFEEDLKILQLKLKNNIDVSNQIKMTYAELLNYLKSAYGEDSLEYQQALNKKLNHERQAGEKQKAEKRKQTQEAKNQSQALFEFETRLLELEDPYEARLRKQKQVTIDWFEKKKELLLQAGKTEKEITDLKNQALEALEQASAERRTKTHASALGAMAKNMSAFGKAGFAVGKALNIAQVMMEAPASAAAAYRSVVGIPVVGPALAPIAAAASLAMSTKQIADIQRAKPPKASFHVGGYSGDGDKYEVAGDVHKGEVIYEQEITKPNLPELLGLRKLLQQGYRLKDLLLPSINLPVPQIPEPQLAYASGGYSGNEESSVLTQILDEIKNMKSSSNIKLTIEDNSDYVGFYQYYLKAKAAYERSGRGD